MNSANPSEVTPKKHYTIDPLSPLWLFWAAVVVLLLSVFYVFGGAGSIGDTVIYPLKFIHSSTLDFYTNRVALGLPIVGVTLVVVWLIQTARGKHRAGLIGLAALMILASSLLSGVFVLRGLFGGYSYKHVARATLAGHVYQLGIIYGQGSTYELYECDWLGLFCIDKHLRTGLLEWDKDLPREMVANSAANSLTILVNGQEDFTFQP